MKALALDGFEKIKWLNERILNECKDCVGAWVLQITGTGVGTLSETGYTPNPIFAYPTLLNKHSEGEEGHITFLHNLDSARELLWQGCLYKRV